MRKILCLLLATFVLTACGASTESPEEMGKVLVKILQADNTEAYLNYIMITEGDFDCLLKGAKPEFREELMRGKSRHEAIKADAIEDWYKTRKKGAADGIVWADIKYVGATYDVKVKEGIPFADIYIQVACKDQLYAVKIDDCIKCGNRWFSVDGLRYKGPAQ